VVLIDELVGCAGAYFGRSSVIFSNGSHCSVQSVDDCASGGVEIIDRHRHGIPAVDPIDGGTSREREDASER